ncbi:NeuD/PglB/VioB family sugar acetyltransferase [Vibrio cholerae]|uniref:NeuD/PglB/VioB family sugar acetyltransferase n=1 Tax=Vibrio cholerae TaxID=666 RepID=UPI002096210E|nr:NeuD/PglB/VioB family sugar acetyltransferase [Vibrio cholerae]EGR4264297.1 acetyltransferase [Vibrio cholerae]EJH4016450.1 NeuD/PglB/VioB family sugar acetyltransferase [Vibrio cholerae]EJH4017518.1 NeuD/PglB/VioB family sugar acetyltransferase [Vibrio cholerae]EKF9092033.1 NeuD/PglB/VioB family sugar acetyltransferase [Vibrio cholerae]EKF9407404.1 NeuD/PglB/VioB family sugar acetyltransferase [Vibrio cholerae]
MNNRLIGVYGASGFGREVMPIIKQQFGDSASFVFIDDGSQYKEVNGYVVLNFEQFLNTEYSIKEVVIAIADSKVREKLSEKLLINNIDQINVLASNCMILDANEIGDGAIFCPFTMVTSNAKIGRGFHANIYSYVAHDCIIGDYVTFAPNAMCNGNVHIQNHVYVGTGAMIKQGTPEKPIIIGEGAIIGMGAVVTKSVKAGDVVFGVPAKSIKRG